jgi:long-subunit fatty acid transport protein
LGKAFFSDQLSVGLMFPISFDVKSESQLKMDSSDPNTRIKAGMDPNITWGAGLLFKMSGTSQLSASYRERKRSDAYVNVNGSVPVSGAPDIEILASGSSPYIYEPRRATLQSNFKLSDKFSWGIWARFNQWKEMPAPVLLLVYTSPSLSTARPDFRARNTVEVATGLGWELAPNMTAYFSYRYSPSPFKNSILFYDRNTHHLGFGMAGFLNSDWKLGFFGRISLLEGGGIYSYAGLGGSLIL